MTKDENYTLAYKIANNLATLKNEVNSHHYIKDTALIDETIGYLADLEKLFDNEEMTNHD